jgi:RNA polymerase sigma-70 factor (ECF subfamily)
MSDIAKFKDLIRRVRAGDDRAAKELVEEYASVIRVEVRLRLGDPRLRRAFDSMDICQSVLLSFFTRAALGQFDLEDPSQLVRLLVGMTRNKVRYQVRRERAQRRDHRRAQVLEPATCDAVTTEPGPSEIVATRDLLDTFRAHLSPDERRMADLRGQGWEWTEVAAEMGGTPEGRRKQLGRALDRVAEQLGLDEDTYE